ncbi:MAG: DUF4249 domain-containing protein [Prevotellaceae bacterium]|jgi:hypothetical protein|nr:DUF4249 domain-containing protein [Prevotellaceae bacterium]
MKKIILILALFTSLVSCNKSNLDEIGWTAYEPKVVVEGSIESGQFASVLLSVSAPISGKKDTATLLTHAIRSAKVSVSDGNESEVLLLRRNNNRMPPFEYISQRIRGEVGKTYYLTVEYGGKIITAETRIPAPVPLDDVQFKKSDVRDSVGYLHISFRNTSRDYYLVWTRAAPQKTFVPCLMGNIDGKQFAENENVSLQINKGIVLYPEPDYTTYFHENTVVQLKFSTLPREGYEFWSSYQNELLNFQNPIFPANTSLKSNIHNGIGIWCGYGNVVYRLDLKNMAEK